MDDVTISMRTLQLLMQTCDSSRSKSAADISVAAAQAQAALTLAASVHAVFQFKLPNGCFT